MSKTLVPEAKQGLSAFVGGEMVKRMVEQYESGLK